MLVAKNNTCVRVAEKTCSDVHNDRDLILLFTVLNNYANLYKATNII